MDDKLKAAERLIEENKKERCEKAKAALEKICKDFNVRFEPIVQIGNENVPVNNVLALKTGITIIPL